MAIVLVFVDLDDTLVDYSESGCFQVDGDKEGPYNLAHGGSEFLRALISTPQLQLHFYSGGPSNRNLGLVRQIFQEIFQEQEDEIEKLMINVFSEEHLVPGDPPKKQLSALPIEDMDLEQSVVVDDTVYHYAAEGEERNFLQIYSCHCDGHSHYAGKVFNMRRKNRLIRALGMILRCLEIVSSAGCAFVEALQAIQWNPEAGAYRHNETNAKEIYELGLKAMRRFTPDLQLVDEEELGIWPWSCKILEESLGHEPDSHFQKNIFLDKDQMVRLLSNHRPLLLPEAAADEDELTIVHVEIVWLGEKKMSVERLPSGVPANVAIATLDRIHPVASAGALLDIDGNHLKLTQRLDSSSTYKYKVVRARI